MKGTTFLKVAISAVVLLAAGCGYTVAGYSSPATFYIEKVTNNTIDTLYEDVVQQAVDGYFVIYGEMASYERAKYILDVRLEKVTLADNIVTATEESVNSNVFIDVIMIVTEKETGREVFSYRNKQFKSFNISQNVSDTLKNRNKAIREAMTDTLDIFRDRFNAQFQ